MDGKPFLKALMQEIQHDQGTKACDAVGKHKRIFIGTGAAR
jgi:hypothetical protein